MTFISSLPNIPEFRLPEIVRRVNQRLPQWPHALSLCLALNTALRLKILPEDALLLCAERSFRVVVEDGGTEALFACRAGRFCPIWRKDVDMPVDVTFRGELHAYLRLLTRQDDPDTLFFKRQLSIEGDTELGLAIKNLLDAIDWPPPLLARLLNHLRPAPSSATP
ncbi:MAG: SCP2 sterol-binding domain-containing protein [Zoogloeaceae bacterium]|jgi:predicted lipid carrier protein YhbT|nr:SCP2 sterol-binding domain-containing protein [Zoogloeaceae bacterium]